MKVVTCINQRITSASGSFLNTTSGVHTLPMAHTKQTHSDDETHHVITGVCLKVAYWYTQQQVVQACHTQPWLRSLHKPTAFLCNQWLPHTST